MKTLVRYFVFVVLTLTTRRAASQDYTLEAATISIGGTATGEGFSLTGGVLTEGAASGATDFPQIDDGFWGEVGIDPAPEIILLDSIAGSSNGQLAVGSKVWLATRFCPTQRYELVSVTWLLDTRSPQIPATVRGIILQSGPRGMPLAGSGIELSLSGKTNPIQLEFANSSYQTRVRWQADRPLELLPNQCYWAALAVDSGEMLTAITLAQPAGEAGVFGRSVSVDGGVTWGDPDFKSSVKMVITGRAITTVETVQIVGIERLAAGWKLLVTGVSVDRLKVQRRPLLDEGEWIDADRVLEQPTTDGITVPSLPAEPQQFYRVVVVR